jgi:hypothetical protein
MHWPVACQNSPNSPLILSLPLVAFYKGLASAGCEMHIVVTHFYPSFEGDLYFFFFFFLDFFILFLGSSRINQDEDCGNLGV